MPAYFKCPNCGHKLNFKQHNELRESYPKAFTPWTPEDDRELEAMLGRGASILDISEMLGRQPTGVIKRMEKLMLKLQPRSDPPEPTTEPVEPVAVPEDTRPL